MAPIHEPRKTRKLASNYRERFEALPVSNGGLGGKNQPSVIFKTNLGDLGLKNRMLIMESEAKIRRLYEVKAHDGPVLS